MNVTINSQVLAAQLRLLNKVVPAKPAIAVLACASLTAEGDKVSFYATDLEVGLSTSCQAGVAMPGTVVIPVGRFLSLVEQFPDGDVEMELGGRDVLVRCGRFTSKLSLMSKDDFPKQPPIAGGVHQLDANGLRSLIARTRYAVSATAQKYVLQGALLTLTEEAAAMVATDGKRLALATMSHEGPPASVIIPMKALDVLANGSDPGDVTMTAGAKHLFFSAGDRTLTTRAADGQFPKYERIIPRDNDKVVTLDRASLAAALRRTTLVSEENRAVWTTIAPGGIELSASSVGMGSANEGVAAEYDGPPMKSCVNGAYVLDFLDSASQPQVTLSYKDPKGALLMTDGQDHIGVVMLLRA